MTRAVTSCAVLLMIPALAGSQTPAPAASQPSTQAPVSLSDAAKASYNAIKLNITQAAEKMPEAEYAFKAGPMPEVRTYGQFIGHLANSNYSLCASVKGEKNPMEGTDYEKTTPKSDLVKALNESLTYCDAVYTRATDQMLMEMTTTPRPRAKGAILFGNIAHNNEHYGNLVTYLRLKGIVPPSTERATEKRRPSQN